MRYWDASAIVPLVVAEPDSELVRTWLSEDDRIATWAWTRTEITAAIERRTREGTLSRQQRREVIERFDAFARVGMKSRTSLPFGLGRPRCWRGIRCEPLTRASLAQPC